MGRSEWSTSPSETHDSGSSGKAGYSPSSPAMEQQQQHHDSNANPSASLATSLGVTVSAASMTTSTTTTMTSPTMNSSSTSQSVTTNGDVGRPHHRRSASRDSSSAQGAGGTTLHWFAVVGDDDEKSPMPNQDGDPAAGRPGSAKEREREEKVRQIREKQEEDRRKKLDELKQHALAAERFREQQEEERRRHIEEVRSRESQRRLQVEERKRAIVEADRERKEHIIKRNQERDVRMETRRRHERGQIVFAFGSSTPRMVHEVADTASFWGSRKSTSSFNVDTAGTGAGGGVGMKASGGSGGGGGMMTDVMSASYHPAATTAAIGVGADRPATAPHHQNRPVLNLSSTSRSMYEVFNWNDGQWDDSPSPPSLSGGGGGMGIHNHRRHRRDVAASSTSVSVSRSRDASAEPRYPAWALGDLSDDFGHPRRFRDGPIVGIPGVGGFGVGRDDIMTQSMSAILPGSPLSAPSSKARRRTDLMPTTPQSQLLPRGACTMETSFHGSTASSSSPGCHGKQQQQQQQRTPPNRAVSLSRLDQLAQPRRRLLQQKQMTPGADGRTDNNNSASRVSPGKSSMSRSMCHLGPKKLLVARGSSSGASPGAAAAAAALTAAATAVAGTLQSSPAAARSSLARSMTHLAASAPPAVRMTRAEKLRLKAKQPEGGSTSTNSASAAREPPARSGATTPSTPSRPLSALSNASQVSNAGSSNVGGVRRRHPPGTVSRLKPRPVSIAGTSVELENRRHGGSASSTTPKRGADVGAPQKAASADKRMSRRSSGPTTPRKEASSASVVAENMVKAGDTGTIKRAPNKSKPASKEPSKEKPASPTPETASAPSTGSPESSLEPSTPVAEKKPFQDEASKTQKEDGDSLGNKPKITTEEEAKAAIAERRRLAREQAEREAEEQKRKEEEARLAEEERLRREEEEQRRFEAEQERLMEEARKAEEDRLKRAIEEAERQAEEEKKRKEEEARLKAEKEELEKRAREEAERLRQEREEKLRQEMEEREARRKKVEAIMLRTRGARGTKEGDQSGPSSVASGSSSSVASSTQASLDSVVAANATPSTNSISSVSSVTGATTPTGGATTTTATTTPNATPVPYPASSVPLDSPTSAFAPGQILMMTDSMTASMYEEAERNLKEEEAAEAANKKVWNRDVTTVNGNGGLFNDGDGKRPMVHSGETNGHANGHVDDGFLVDFSSLQTGVQDPLISSLDAVNKQTNPFAAALDHSSSNMASNAIDLLS